MATTCGAVARADSVDAWPAYTPPSIGSASRSTTSCPSREPSSSATDTSSSPSGSTVSFRARARPSSESTPVVASASRSRGTPSSVRGSGRSAPRVQIWVDPAAGCTTSSPSSATRPTASGRRASIDSAPTSTSTPPTVPSRSLPPTTGELSRTSTDSPDRLSSRAAVESGDTGADHHYVGSGVGHARHSAIRSQSPPRGVGPPSERVVRPMLAAVPSAPYVVPPLLLIATLVVSAVAKIRDPRDTSSVFLQLRLPRLLLRLRVPRLLPYGELVLAAFLLLASGVWYVARDDRDPAAVRRVLPGGPARRAPALSGQLQLLRASRAGRGHGMDPRPQRRPAGAGPGHLGRLLGRGGCRRAARGPRAAGPGWSPVSAVAAVTAAFVGPRAGAVASPADGLDPTAFLPAPAPHGLLDGPDGPVPVRDLTDVAARLLVFGDPAARSRPGAARVVVGRSGSPRCGCTWSATQGSATDGRPGAAGPARDVPAPARRRRHRGPCCSAPTGCSPADRSPGRTGSRTWSRPWRPSWGGRAAGRREPSAARRPVRPP